MNTFKLYCVERIATNNFTVLFSLLQLLLNLLTIERNYDQLAAVIWGDSNNFKIPFILLDHVHWIHKVVAFPVDRTNHFTINVNFLFTIYVEYDSNFAWLLLLSHLAECNSTYATQNIFVFCTTNPTTKI